MDGMKKHDPDNLTPEEERCVQIYIREGCRDQSAAYRQAFPRSARWKPQTVWKRASELFAKGKVSGRIAATIARLREVEELTTERVLLETARLATIDPRRALDESGQFLPLKDWPDDVAAAVQSIEFVEGKPSKIRFWDKNSALEKLFKNKGLFGADHAQAGRIVERAAQLSDADRDAIGDALDAYFARRLGVDRVADAGPGHGTTH